MTFELTQQFESAMNRWPEAHQDADKEMSNKLETLKLNDDGGAQVKFSFFKFLVTEKTNPSYQF